MNFVTPAVAVGSLDEAANSALLRRHGIEAVLSLTEVDFEAGALHEVIAVQDRQPLPAAAIGRITAFIHRQVSSRRKVLVHCQMGISRSPALVACYLHEYEGMALEAAIGRIQRARPCADPHPALLASIEAHYAGTGKPELVDLSANENPFGPSPAVAEALGGAGGGIHRYPDRRGAGLRSALAERLGVAAEQIVLGNGSCEILDLAARAALGPGEEAIIGVPSFMPYRSAIRKAYGHPVAVPLQDFQYDLEAMADRVGERTRLVVLGNPNNPTGKTLPRAALERFLDGLPASVLVVLDEAYREYVADPGFADALDYVRDGRRVLAVRTFSKVHGLAGLRIGYGIGPAALAAELEVLRPHYNTNSLAQQAALAALGDAPHVTASIAANAEGRQFLSGSFAALGLDFVPSEANFILVRTGEAEAVTAALLARGVRVKSAAPFGTPDHIRVSVGRPEENQFFIEALTQVLGKQDHQNQGEDKWQ